MAAKKSNRTAKRPTLAPKQINFDVGVAALFQSDINALNQKFAVRLEMIFEQQGIPPTERKYYRFKEDHSGMIYSKPEE